MVNTHTSKMFRKKKTHKRCTIKKVKFNLHKNQKFNFDVSQTKTKESKIVKNFLKTLDMIKVYHWKTKSFAVHQATETLHERLSKNIDQFVEVLMGKNEQRIHLLDHHLHLYDVNTKKEFREKLYDFREFLIDLERTFDPSKDSDLFTIRDEMLVHINQALYLLTMDK